MHMQVVGMIGFNPTQPPVISPVAPSQKGHVFPSGTGAPMSQWSPKNNESITMTNNRSTIYVHQKLIRTFNTFFAKSWTFRLKLF